MKMVSNLPSLPSVLAYFSTHKHTHIYIHSKQSVDCPLFFPNVHSDMCEPTSEITATKTVIARYCTNGELCCFRMQRIWPGLPFVSWCKEHNMKRRRARESQKADMKTLTVYHGGNLNIPWMGQPKSFECKFFWQNFLLLLLSFGVLRWSMGMIGLVTTDDKNRSAT